MLIKVLASGSKGNCTAISTGEAILLLDAGIGFKQIQSKLGYAMPTAALITHEHGDHAKLDAITNLIHYGADVFMTAGTIGALQFDESYRIHLMQRALPFELAGFNITPIGAFHDAREPVSFVIENHSERLWYITDTGHFNPIFFTLKPPTHIIVEANHNPVKLQRACIDIAQKKRIRNNHLSFLKVMEFFANIDKSALQKVHLIHVSSRFGDKVTFRQIAFDYLHIPVAAH